MCKLIGKKKPHCEEACRHQLESKVWSQRVIDKREHLIDVG